MLKVLFVDDDAIARRSMATRIDWASNGWKLIYTAKDAVDALDYMKQEQPDVIISDIKMPVMDGISMAMIARNYYPDIKYIFLSGYKEFEYAKQALKLNAVDYLNKPVDNEQLTKVIKEAEILSEKDRLANELIRSHFRSYENTSISETHLKAANAEDVDLLSQVKKYLEQNYWREDLTLTKIAEHFYVNHCYLTSLFKEAFGINLYDYLIQTRMKKAGHLVATTNMKVYEIAEAVGYKNSQYFSVSFKKYFHCTVMEYKKKSGSA